MNRYLDSSLESAQLDCPECQMPVRYFDVQGSSFYICPHCHTYFEYEGEKRPKVFSKYDGPVPADARLLPVGTQGTLRGRECRVVGIIQRTEQKYPVNWVEFQLFFPDKKEYQQLAVFEGHWMLVWPIKERYRHGSGQVLQIGDEVFRLFNRYRTRVLWAAGEFDWNIQKDQTVDISEYIAPPQLVVHEQGQWYRGEHLEPKEVKKAFDLSASLPYREGVGAIQPNPVANWPVLRALTLATLALLLLFQLGKGLVKPSRDLVIQDFSAPIDSSTANGTGRVLVGRSFELKEEAALQIDLRTNLDNQWLELPVSLVNETTGRGFEFTKTIEYYHGYEGGENWNEGDISGDAVLERVPAGRYHLNLYPISGGTTGSNAPPLSLQVTVTENPTLWSNFWVTALLLLLFPAVQWFRRTRFETNRWEDSDFAP
ncbi:DUF4178 domain-containing protein [Hymenobacter sp. ASUV-10]|uniref:DUF4178 domain-containing protein n=1 Tax=Hymenobacter aranciens TaxID=3063996 RepID=A0ABT9BGZ5_9BACT|nr:DUF4178 domain-containing protein [Hymenobacter sp. ASUV-10]MDO7877532.1 DUF4178 domain-containing protein [Hymenobacter sp. ASUV-10]